MSICSICHGGCCHRYMIDLTGYDIFNILKTLDLDVKYFMQAVPVREEDFDYLDSQAALFKFTDDELKSYYRFCLRQNKSQFFPDTGKCMFLQEWTGKDLGINYSEEVIARCGMYGCRPLTCAIFPARLDDSGLIGYVLDPYLNAKKKQNPALNLCPRPLENEDFADHSGEIIRNLSVHKFEMEFFRGLAKDWNKNPKSLNDLMIFLKKVYSNRIIYEENYIEKST